MRKICKMKTKSGANSSTTVTKVKVHLDDRNAGGADEASVTPVASTALTAPVVSSVCTETELLMNIAKHTHKNEVPKDDSKTHYEEIHVPKSRKRQMMQKQVEVHLGPPSECTRSSSVNDTSLNERANHDVFDDIIITARTSWKINDLDPMYTTNVKTVQFRETREQPLSFRNPLYEHTCSARKRRLVSYPFGTKVKRCAVEKTIHSEASNEGSREDLRGAESIYDQVFPPPLRSGRIKSMADERECLAKALQANIVPLVDCLQFNYSELPEMMISGGHITEDECRMIRDDLSRKDQVRYLISRTKGRSLGDMQAFLAIISKDAPDVVQKIKDKFEENKRNNVKCTTCALCQCYNTIDIKDIVDNLWSEQAIPDGFYNEVVACSKPRGSQTNLWIRLIDFLNSKQNSERMILFENLFNSILLKGNFGFLVKPMRQLVNVRNVLECNCFLMRKMSLDRRLSCWSSNRPDSSSTCSPRSSYSDRPSSSLSRELLSDVDAYERINIDRDSFKMCDMKQTACIGIDTIDDTGTRRRVNLPVTTLETIREENYTKQDKESSANEQKPDECSVCLRRNISQAVKAGPNTKDSLQNPVKNSDKAKRFGRNLDKDMGSVVL